MKKEHILKWLEALRSGKYVQNRGSLANKTPFSAATSFCCIGVAGKVLDAHLPEFPDTVDVIRKLGIPGVICSVLVQLNDRDEASFSEIADWIEANMLPEAK